MMKLIAIDVAAVAETNALAGRTTGIEHHKRLARAGSHSHGPLVIFDMAGVELITGSYFAAALLTFWTDRTSTPLADATPVLANLSQPLEDEIKFVLGLAGVALWSGTAANNSFTPKHPPLGPPLDDVTRTILGLLEERDAITAQELADSIGRRVVSAYANRLSTMHQQHLVRRQQQGRGYRYLLPWKEA